ncbi:hydrolase [Jiangella aurantiaca]|uniref:Hydrolase n=1 Tax=Jiangella aurantiaca TaxID=2530373 RepID=A0A4R5ABS6_9ACTN|nr:hydrolase [Jiangella aurantiaca]
MGEAAFWTDAADEPRLRLVLGHGAGGGPNAADLEALSRTLPAEGVTVVRFEQPWRLAGKKVAPRTPVLDEAWLAALATLPRDVPLVIGGRSSGARVACRTAAELDAAAVVCLAFPLHLPGKPEASRLPELTRAAEKLPVLVVQGERDTFGGPDEFPPGQHRLVAVPGADHGMRVLKGHSQREAIDAVVAAVQAFLAPIGE